MKKLVLLIVSALLLTSCSDEIRRWQKDTSIKNACETIWWKYSEDTRCCYERWISEWIIVKECSVEILEEKAFIYLNFNKWKQ